MIETVLRRNLIFVKGLDVVYVYILVLVRQHCTTLETCRSEIYYKPYESKLVPLYGAYITHRHLQ